jgi:PAS domain S-box-containing protein
VLSVVLSSRLSRPIERLKRSADEIARGNLDVRVESRSRDELGELASAFNSMASSLSAELTERERAEGELRESEEKYRHVVDNAQEAIFVTQEGLVEFCNPKLEEFTGYTRDELESSPFLRLVHPEDRQTLIDRHSGRLSGEKVPARQSFRSIGKDGSVKRLEVSSIPIEWRGRPALLAFVADTTDQALLEQRMYEYEELDRMKSNLLSTVSHELRTPLAAIKGYSTLILDYEDRLETGEKHDYLRSIDRSTDRLAELVDHLLDMSRLDSGLMRLDRETASIGDLVVQAIAEARVSKPHHDIRCDLGHDMPLLHIDPKRVRQVLDNLLGNACKYSEQGTTVVVSARRNGTELIVGVADQGVGISAEDADRIFDRMYRVESRLSPNKDGVGLGLAICKGLVEAHGGRIWVESAEGEGSTFRFTLPME